MKSNITAAVKTILLTVLMDETRLLTAGALLLCLCCAIPGCTAPAEKAPSPATVPVPVETAAATTETMTDTPSLPATESVPVSPEPAGTAAPAETARPSPTVTATGTAGRIYVPLANDPKIENSGMIIVPDMTVDDCIMRQAFPQFAANPAYGTHASPPYLDGVSAFEYNRFLREYYEGIGQSPAQIGFTCKDAPGTPEWEFLQVSATIMPRNAKPSLYEIAVVLKKDGRTIAYLSSEQMLTLEQSVSFATYIPVRETEIDDIVFGGFEFYRLTNT